MHARWQKMSLPVIQGGMSIGFSLDKLAGTVALHGGAGTIASVGIDVLLSHRYGKKMTVSEALIVCLTEARKIARGNGLIGVNIMYYIQRQYIDSVYGAVHGGADYIACGAGLAMDLPQHVGASPIALIPIVSSVRALRVIQDRWEKRYSRIPDAVIVEGPLAGGHLGFTKYGEITNPLNTLESLFFPVQEFVHAHGNYPIIVAGGVEIPDIANWLNRGAYAVQMATRFLASHESGANAAFKEAIVQCTKEDIIVSDMHYMPPGSPCGLPFRIIRTSPMFADPDKKSHCTQGFSLQKDAQGRFTQCPAHNPTKQCFCICTGLMAASEHPCNAKPLWTVGTQAANIEHILSVEDIMSRIHKIL